jgi:hypothetical protein
MYRLVGQSNATLVCLKTMKICFGDFVYCEDLFVNQNTVSLSFNILKTKTIKPIDSLNINHKANLNIIV